MPISVNAFWTIFLIGTAIVIAIASAMLWIEQRHVSLADTPAPTLAELTARASAAGCTTNDNLPYSPSCFDFLGESVAIRSRWPSFLSETKAASTATLTPPPPCAVRDDL